MYFLYISFFMKNYLFTILFVCVTFSFFSQRGKDLAGNITTTAIVNVYTPLTANASAGNTTINVLSSAGYSIGDLIYIIQMQGASVNCFIFGSGAGPQASNFGRITNYNNAGNNEYAQVSQIAGNIITVDCGLRNNYTIAGKVQVLRVPRYTTLNIANTGTILCPAWNGTVGGAIAIEVNGATTINASGRINASSTGFRGGITIGKTGGFGFAGQWGHNNQSEGAYKGESIAGDVVTYSVGFQGAYCKGAVANGGGGGNGNNGGGGGGANGGDTSLYTGTGNPDISVPGYITAWNLESPGFAGSTSSGGGKGGYTYSTASVSPITAAPNGSVWGAASDYRRVEGGLGGRPLNYNTGRLFLGGGGGAGDENDTYGGAGGRGGGIINMITYGNVSGGGQIISNGQNGFNTITSPAPFNNVGGRDGAGGGGGGGAILINSSGSVNTLTVSARGGTGGNQQMVNAILFGGSTSQAYGPGGGGGGGFIGTTAAAITTILNGGGNGIVQYLSGIENCQIDNLFPSNGSTMGGSGTNISTLTVVPTITAVAAYTICANNSATVTAATNGTGTIGWYTSTAGGVLLGNGSPFTTSVFPSPGTFTVFAGYCPGGIYRVPVLITVLGSPTLTPVSTTICSGLAGTVSVSGATTYSWSTGPTTSSISASPTLTTIYTVTGTTGGCSSSTNATITVNPSGTISVNSPSICFNQTVTLSAGVASTYTWSTGSNNQTVAVSPTATSVFTINATSPGGCLMSNTGTVTVISNPTVTAANATICSGTSSVITASGATTYSWSTGAVTASVSVNPSVTTIYTVTGTTGSCINTKTVQVNVNNTPTVSVNSQTICSGTSTVLTASGATSYSWNTGPVTNTISASPTVTTVYTVTGTSTGCSSSTTGTITVNPGGTISVNSPTMCFSQTVTLSAGVASTYTWSTGSNNQTVAVSPTATSVFTINATSPGGCLLSNTGTVTVFSNPTVTAANATICSGTSSVITASGATTYSWSTGAVTASVSVSPSVTTIYTVTGTTGSCINTKTLQVNVNSTPTLSVNSQTICSGTNAVLTASGATSYSWNTGPTTSSISTSPTVTTIYTVTGTSAGCSSINTATVNVVTAPTVIVNSPTVCAGNSITVTASGAASYSWSNGPVTASISVSPTTTTIYTVTGTNGGTCTNVNTSTVSVSPQASVSLNANTFNICGAQSASIIASANGTYSWSTGAITNSITTAIAGVYNVTVTNSCGTAVQSATVVSGAAPAFTITPSSSVVCSGQTITLNTAGSSGTFTWSNGAGNTPSITVSNSGIYTATLTNGCGTATYSVNIIDGTSAAVNLSASSNTICSGGSVTLTATGTGTFAWSTGAGNIAAITVTNTGVYTASVSNMCGTSTATISVVNGAVPNVSIVPSAGSFCSGQTATLNANGSAGTYSWTNGTPGSMLTTTSAGIYTAVVTNSCGTSTDTYNVVFQSMPAISIRSSTRAICPGSFQFLFVEGTLAGGLLLWNTTPANTTFSQMIISGGIYSVTCTNICGSSSASVSISQSTLSADFNFTPEGGTAPLSVAFTNMSSNNLINQWTFGNGANSANINDNSFYTAAGIYTVNLTIMNPDSCYATATKTIEIKDQTLGIIPEVLTPNNDGKNDVFEIKGINNYPDNDLQIFNRWGNLIYKIKGYNNTWDGTPNKNGGSGKLPAGTYFYILNLGDKDSQVFRGFVELMY